MVFELKQGEKVPKGVRRIVGRRIDKALKALKSGGKTVSDPAVYDARKRFKEIRGTLRLVRGELGDKAFQRENRTFRDAARPLSALRDAAVVVDSLDELVKLFGGRVKAQNMARLRRALLKNHREARKEVIGRDGAVEGIVRQMRKAKTRIKNWPLKRRGWKAIEEGLRQVYDQGRRAMKKAVARNSDEALHEWRKRAKDMRYELELLESTAAQVIRPLAQQAHLLADLLGDDHDLAILRTSAQEQFNSGSAIEGELLFALIEERRSTLQREAISVGTKLYKESPRNFVRRLEGYWKAARQKPH
jgi:CHAD domain-containing protein